MGKKEVDNKCTGMFHQFVDALKNTEVVHIELNEKNKGQWTISAAPQRAHATTLALKWGSRSDASWHSRSGTTSGRDGIIIPGQGKNTQPGVKPVHKDLMRSMDTSWATSAVDMSIKVHPDNPGRYTVSPATSTASSSPPSSPSASSSATCSDAESRAPEPSSGKYIPPALRARGV